MVSIPERGPRHYTHISPDHTWLNPAASLQLRAEQSQKPTADRNSAVKMCPGYNQTGAWGVKGPIQGFKKDTAEVGENFHIHTKEKTKDKCHSSSNEYRLL